MRKMTAEELNEMVSGRQGNKELRAAIVNLELNAGVFVSREEWKGSSGPRGSLRNIRTRSGHGFISHAAKDGWYIMRIK